MADFADTVFLDSEDIVLNIPDDVLVFGHTLTGPQVTFISPTPGQVVGVDQPIVVEVTSLNGDVRTIIEVRYPTLVDEAGRARVDGAYSGTAFQEQYASASSKMQVSSSAVRYSVMFGSGAWPAVPELHVYSVDAGGKEL